MNRDEDFIFGLIFYTGFIGVCLLVLAIPPALVVGLLFLLAVPKLLMIWLVVQAVWAAIAVAFVMLTK